MSNKPRTATDKAVYIASRIEQILTALGEDVEREGLKETSLRAAKFYEEFILQTPEPFFNLTTFAAEGMDEMVIQKNIPFFSLCEHHMLPFFGHAAVAYVPNKKIIGLSKLTRLVDFYARRLQNQERITKQVAEKLNTVLEAKGVAVCLKARHMCMEMRGCRSVGGQTLTSFTGGVFREKPEARAEWLKLLGEI